METILVNLIAGALGGVGAGKSSPTFDLGMIGNIIAGAVGGGLLGQWLKFLSVNAVGGLVNFAVYVAVLHQGAVMLAGRAELLAYLPYVGVAAGSAAGLFLNFAASKRLIFR